MQWLFAAALLILVGCSETVAQQSLRASGPGQDTEADSAGAAASEAMMNKASDYVGISRVIRLAALCNLRGAAWTNSSTKFQMWQLDKDAKAASRGQKVLQFQSYALGLGIMHGGAVSAEHEYRIYGQAACSSVSQSDLLPVLDGISLHGPRV